LASTFISTLTDGGPTDVGFLPTAVFALSVTGIELMLPDTSVKPYTVYTGESECSTGVYSWQVNLWT